MAKPYFFYIATGLMHLRHWADGCSCARQKPYYSLVIFHLVLYARGRPEGALSRSSAHPFLLVHMIRHPFLIYGTLDTGYFPRSPPRKGV